MKWSWRIARVAGIDIRMHATFPLLFAWIALIAFQSGVRSASALVGTFALFLAIFVLVVLHECSHALTARHFGIHTRDITLLPIGGVARLERMPRVPRQELLITIAGPALNVAFAIILYAALAITGNLHHVSEIARAGAIPLNWGSALAQLMIVNVSLAVFNLLPAFPLDGGRVLRALLAMRSGDYAKATVTAARIGRAFALIFGLAGLFVLNNPLLVIIALFVWLSAATEAHAVQTAAALEGVPLRALVVTDVRTISPNDSLGAIAEATVHGFQQDYPVVENGQVVGMLTRSDLIRGLAKFGRDAMAASAMRAEFPTVAPETSAEDALKGLSSSGVTAIPVMRGRQLVGLLTSDNVMEYLMLRGAVTK